LTQTLTIFFAKHLFGQVEQDLFPHDLGEIEPVTFENIDIEILGRYFTLLIGRKVLRSDEANRELKIQILRDGLETSRAIEFGWSRNGTLHIDLRRSLDYLSLHPNVTREPQVYVLEVYVGTRDTKVERSLRVLYFGQIDDHCQIDKSCVK
jgi:hypothetical protein